MKNLWAFSAKILLVLLLVCAWYINDLHHRQDVLAQENQRLQAELLEKQQLAEDATAKAKELEKKTLDGILKETNKVVISGWETLLDTVETELNKAREMIKEDMNNPQPSEPQLDLKEEPVGTEPVIEGERT